jgi:Asp-tRNA(Asn)/Glu-tRNA(Gln) amidotransferase A subunit family amidase
MTTDAEAPALGACDAARMMRDGALGAEDYVRSCIERIVADEGRVRAWAWFDPDYALDQARKLDLRRAAGLAIGPLHGVPVGLKDIIDTAAVPTENGSVLHAGRIPDADAAVVRRLRAAGAVIMGKTVATEFATYAPGKTRNPHDPARTPGGSSSGSAAAVAAGMVPLAVGTQTNGSVIRPAAYCGVVGYKPSFGLIARSGILTLSPALDQVGVFARGIEDAALLAQCLAGEDEADPATRPGPRPPLLQVCRQPPPLPPTLAFVPTPMWGQADYDIHAAFAELEAHLGERMRTVPLAAAAREALDWHRTIMEADIAGSLEREYERGRDRLSDALRAQIERGRLTTAVDYRRAVGRIPALYRRFERILDECDALLTPATTGTAPKGLESTGDPVFCTLWSLCGMPAVTLPLMQGDNGLPLGVQLVGRRGDDARLLRTARWLWSRVMEPGA